MRNFLIGALALGLATTAACKSKSETPVVTQNPATDLENRVTPSTPAPSTMPTPAPTVATPVEPVPEADNTGRNDEPGKTADQSMNGASDLDITAKIRQAVMDDDKLSTDAHNVKIIVEKGHVTLRGPVSSQAEKTTVEQTAIRLVGPANVTSELEIAH